MTYDIDTQNLEIVNKIDVNQWLSPIGWAIAIISFVIISLFIIILDEE
jgi:hypothetical protein